MATLIAGIGTALPCAPSPTSLFVEHAKKFSCVSSRQQRVLEELYRRTEIKSRCSVLAGGSYGKEAERVFAPPRDSDDAGPTTGTRMRYYASEVAPLAVAACERALSDAAVNPATITHVVTASCTGFNAPGFDIELVERLPLPRSIARTHVGFMGCHGGMNALRVASAYAGADSNARVLVCCSELCSLHFQYGWETDKLVANSLFADGSAAFVVTAGSALDRQWQCLGQTSFIVPESSDAMVWQIGDHGFRMHLSSAVPDLVSRHLEPFLAQWLRSLDLCLGRVNHWAVHPGGPRILAAAQECLRLKSEDLRVSRQILAECGNMSSPTVWFILERLRAEGATGLTVVLGFGPGLTIEAAVLELK